MNEPQTDAVKRMLARAGARSGDVKTAMKLYEAAAKRRSRLPSTDVRRSSISATGANTFAR